MANRSPEQDLIDVFVQALQAHDDEELRMTGKPMNDRCRSRTYADVEYISESGVWWAIEAKSNDSSDDHNTVHKIFGELLKETGRTRSQPVKFGLLLPEAGLEFYSEAFSEIDRNKFIQFGELVPIAKVFYVRSNGSIGSLDWSELYDYTA